MKSLTANLKQLYQCPDMWLYHVGFLFPTIPMTLEVATKSETSLPFPLPPMAMPLMFSFCYGAVIGSLVAEILRKPFTFLLPKHFKTMRLMLFWIWFGFILLFSFILMLAYIAGANLLPYTSVCLLGLMGLSYWIGAIILTRAKRAIFVFLIAIVFFTASNIFKTILATSPLAITLSCLILSFFIFCIIDFKGHARRVCNTPRQSAFAFSAKRLSSLQTHKNSKKNQIQPAFRMNNFFIGRIRSNVNSTIFSNLWGQSYLLIAASSRRLIFVIPVGILTLIVIHPFITQKGNFPVYDFVLIWMVSTQAIRAFDNHRYRSFLLLGRKAHFFRGAVVFGVVSLFFAIILVIYIFLFNLTANFFPTLSIMNKTLTITPIPWPILLVPIILLPISSSISIFFKKPLQRILAMGTMLLFYTIAFTITTANIATGRPVVLFILIVIVLTWGTEFYALYYDSMKRSLC